MKIAAISDIHGNLPALDAVLADIAAQGVDVTVNLGDILSGPLWITETADRLRALDLPTLAGNHERQLPDGRLVVNPGSVGLQAYDDEHPHPHWIENGSPHARYALLMRMRQGWRVDLRSVPYEHEAAARLADANGRPDWSIALRTGFMHRVSALPPTA